MAKHQSRWFGAVLLILPALGSIVSGANWQPRCAVIVDTQAIGKTNSIASLVEASLSEQHVDLVDRQSIDRLLQEQYLSESGLVDAEHAISVGKLLSANILALISQSPDGSVIVVFDAETGVRLEDSATTANGAALAGELSSEILHGIDKAKRGRDAATNGAIKTVALQTVRNADLPADRESLGQAAGAILIRRLTASPDITVLERARLTHVTAERQLTGGENALIASTVSIELQIARNPNGAGIIASAVLDFASHDRRAIPGVAVPTENPNDIANAMLPQIVQMLKATAPKPLNESDRVAESKRFVRETFLMWSHADVPAALDAAEAAYALNPGDFDVAATHARAVLVAGMNCICTGDFADPRRRPSFNIGLGPKFGIDRTKPRIEPADMTLSLQLIGRACDELDSLEDRNDAPRPAMASNSNVLVFGLDAKPVTKNAQELLRRYVGSLRWEMFQRDPQGSGLARVQLDTEQNVLLAEIQRKCRHRRLDIETEQAESVVRDQQTLDSYEDFVLFPLFEESRCLWSEDGATWTHDWKNLIEKWVALEKKFRPPHAVAPIFEEMTRIPLAVQHVGRPDYVEFSPSCDWNWRMRAEDWRYLVDALQELRQLPGRDVPKLVDQISDSAAQFIHPTDGHAVAAMGTPTTSQATVTSSPSAADQQQQPEKPLVGPGTLWPDSRVLVDFGPENQHEDGGYVVLPKIDYSSRRVYALSHPTFGNDRRMDIDLDCFDSSDGTCRAISVWRGQGRLDELPNPRSMSVNHSSANLDGSSYVFCSTVNGIFVFPLNGDPAITVNARNTSLPSGNYYQAAALLDKVLYLAIGYPGRTGYLVSVDLKGKSVCTLASGTRLANENASDDPDNRGASGPQNMGSPFDDAAPLVVWHMQADEADHRIVFLVSNPNWPSGLSGWWEFRPSTGKFRSLISLEMKEQAAIGRRITWAHSLKDRKIIYSVKRGKLSILDLATNTSSPLPPVPTAHDQYNGFTSPALNYPLAEADGWIWGKFGRYRTNTDAGGTRSVELQCFTPVSNSANHFTEWPAFLEPLDGDDVVVGDTKGLWLLHVPSNDPSAMQRLLPPPRPLGTPRAAPTTRDATSK